ncbi:MAG: flagellar motor protein MotB [Pseudomonadota bacterium]
MSEAPPATMESGPSKRHLFELESVEAAAPVEVSKNGQVWIITFTDLVALMLTFFVLMFSMSRIDQVQWQNLTDALSRSLDQIAEPREPKPAKQLDIQRIAYRPGGDLDYLSAVLADHMADHDALTSVFLARRTRQLIIALPSELLFKQVEGTEVIDPEGRRALFVIGGLVGKLGNRVEVAGHHLSDQTRSKRSDWLQSLRRAEMVAEVLTATGYDETILVRGYGTSQDHQIADLDEEQFQRLADRIYIIVHSDAGEAP